MSYKHSPVLLKEVLENLNLKKGDTCIDCTLGGAGYSMAIARIVGDSGKVISIDADNLAIDNAKKLIKNSGIKNITLVHNNFRNLEEIAAEYLGEASVDGVVFDLGLSSAQLDDQKRGFSFQGNRPLDMSFGVGVFQETIYLINDAPLLELTRIFREYGEEVKAYQLAKVIVAKRKQRRIENTEQLVDIIKGVIKVKPGAKINPATKVFQALRMATNDELGSLKLSLESAEKQLKSGGRLVVVSFHSGEDRIVKNYLKTESRNCICLPEVPLCNCQHQAKFKIINKKPITAEIEELEANPRSRSAKLRVAEKI